MNFNRELIVDILNINSIENSDDGVKVSFCLNKNDEIFIEHFEGNPILPGAYTLEIVGQLMASYISYCESLGMIKQVSFMSPIIPEDLYTLNIKNSNKFSNDQYGFVIRNKSGVTCCLGKLELRETA